MVDRGRPTICPVRSVGLSQRYWTLVLECLSLVGHVNMKDGACIVAIRNIVGLSVEVEGTDHTGHTVSLNGHPVYFRPYDGSRTPEVLGEFISTLGDLVRIALGYSEEEPQPEDFLSVES